MVGQKNVLITGSSGLIGTVLRHGLEHKYNLSGVDVQQSGEFKCLQADMTDLRAISPAFKGIDTVIDLAAQAENSDELMAVLMKDKKDEV